MFKKETTKKVNMDLKSSQDECKHEVIINVPLRVGFSIECRDCGKEFGFSYERRFVGQ